MQHRTSRRLLAGVGAAFAAVALTGAPAAAAPTQITLHTDDMAITPGYYGYGGVWAEFEGEDILETISFDISGIAGFATFNPDVYDLYGYQCTPAGTIVTCAADVPVTGGDEDEGWTNLFDFEVEVNEEAKPGSEGAIKIKAEFAGGTTATSTTNVLIGEEVDLGTLELPLQEAKPGGTVKAPIVAKNLGTNAIDGFYLLSQSAPGVTPTRDYGNCDYLSSDDLTEDLGVSGELMRCYFDQSIAPGETLRVPEGFGYQIAKDMWAPIETGGYAEWMTKGDYELFWDDSHFPWKKGTGAPMTLTEVSDLSALGVPQLDNDWGNNATRIDIKVVGDQKADVVAIGSKVSADQGKTVTLTAGVRNAGPATLRGFVGGWMPIGGVAIPAGTTVVRAPESCYPILSGDKRENWEFGEQGEAGHDFYVCFPGDTLRAGETVEHPFDVKVEESFATSTGELQLMLFYVESEGEGKDLNTGNNRADLVVNSNGTGTIGGGEGDGGQGGGLPVTGVQAGLIGGIGAALLAAGVIGFVLARRRRTTFVA